MVKANPFHREGFLNQPELADCLQQGECAHDIGVDKRPGIQNGTVYMGFGSKVSDSINLIAAQQIVHQSAVADISLNKDVARSIRQVFEVLLAAGIGEDIQIDDMHLRLGLEEKAHKIRADESGPAGDKYILHSISL